MFLFYLWDCNNKRPCGLLVSCNRDLPHCWILPPSENKCSFSYFSRENSGILPKRHVIQIPLDEHYSLMYNIISGRISLDVQKSILTACISTIFGFHPNSTGYGSPSTPTTGCNRSWETEEAKSDFNWKKTNRFTIASGDQKGPPWTQFIPGRITNIAKLQRQQGQKTKLAEFWRACQEHRRIAPVAQVSSVGIAVRRVAVKDKDLPLHQRRTIRSLGAALLEVYQSQPFVT